MSWFSEYIGDPIKALIAKAAAGADADLKALAGKAAAALPAAPISATAETAFEAALTTAVDGVLADAVGQIPVAGAVLAPEAVAAGNAALDYAVQKGTAALNSLAADAKATLASFAASQAVGSAATTAPGATAALGAVG